MRVRIFAGRWRHFHAASLAAALEFVQRARLRGYPAAIGIGQ